MKHLLDAAHRSMPRLSAGAVSCCAAAFLLAAAAPGGQYAPWSLAAAAAAGTGWRGLSATLCAVAGALAFLDFQPGLRHGAAAILIFCANTALCTTRLYLRPWFRPAAAVSCAALVQFVYLLQRSGRDWALWIAALTLLYGCTALLPCLLTDDAPAEDRRRARFLLLLGGCAALSPLQPMGFSSATTCTALLLLAFTRPMSLSESAAAGALAGLVLDLCGSGELYLTAVLCAASAAASCLSHCPRLTAIPAFCITAVLAALLLGEPRPLSLLCESAAASGVWLLLPPSDTAAAPDSASSPAQAAPAAAFQAVYESLAQQPPLLQPENPVVLFDRAAQQVCRDCPLRAHCWQLHYTDTCNAFNDACPALLRRGKPLAEDFPLHFSTRCIRFPQLLSALDHQLHDYLQRRLHHARLKAAYRLAREQYAQVAQALSSTVPPERPRRTALTCRTAFALRPKTGETLCGDQCVCFDVGQQVYLALSDGMGSGEAAHHEAAMTIRLLRRFLESGILPAPALKTLNTAAMLRSQSGGAFTTIDLACFHRAAATLTLYKYGAAPSYLKKHGTVTRCQGQCLPAGLESADRDVPPQCLPVSPGTWLILVSDGVAGDDDEWLQDLLAGWEGTSPRLLADELLRQSAQRTGGADDCAVLVLAIDGHADGSARSV